MTIVVFITAKNTSEAKKISQALVKEHLAACVNIVPKVQSFFWWGGKVDAAKEVLMIVKSQRSCFQKIIKRVKALHSYQVPEVIALPIIDGEKQYMKWLSAAVKK